MTSASAASRETSPPDAAPGGPEAAPPDARVPGGELLAGLEIVGELGRGADTVVYRVRRHGHEYALKLLDSPTSDAEQALRLFRREAALLAGVDHASLPRIHEVGQHGGMPYLLMDLVQGRSLTQELAGGPLPVPRAVALTVDVAGALAALHRTGLVHRDVKPDNIMVLPSGEARLIDFGLATKVAAGGDDLAVGTLAYASPEQSGTLNRPVDQRSDLYSLGVVLFVGVTGVLPFSAPEVSELLRMHAVMPPPDPAELVSGVGDGLASVIRTLLAKDPDDRYQDGGTLLADLRRLVADPFASFVAGQGPTPDPPRERLSGRTGELAALVARGDRAMKGAGGGVLISGAGGAGKSRLAREFVLDAAEKGVLVLHGKSSADDAVPLAPLRAAIDAYLEHLDTLPPQERAAAHDRVRAAAGAAAPLLAPLSPALIRLLAAGPLAEEDRHEQFHAAVVGFLAGLARQGDGLFLLLDDVQWLDGGSRRVLQQLAAVLPGLPLLLVATARDDDDSAEGLDRFAEALGTAVDLRLALSPMTDAEVAELVASRLPGIDAGSRLARLLNVRGAGNPFVIVEYLLAVVDAGLLRPSWGSWLVDEEALDALELPLDALGLVLTRVRGLGADSRRLLTVAAVTGSRFRASLLAAVCELDPSRVSDLLREAAGRALVESRGGDHHAFLHDRIREALLADLDDPAAADLHRRVAEALYAAGTGDPDEVYALARHSVLGDPMPPARVVAACLAAGRLALDDHAPDRAVTFLAQAEAAGVVQDSPFLRLSGIALARNGRHEEARERYERALACESEPLRRADLFVLLANVYRASWDTTGALQAVRDGLAEAGSPWRRNPVLLIVSTLWIIITGLLVAVTTLGAGRATGRTRERFSLICELHEVAAYVCILGMRPEEMVLHGLRSLYAAARLGPSPQYVRAVGSIGLTSGALRLHRLSRRVFRPARRVADEIADPRLIADVATQEGAAAFLGAADDGQIWEQAMLEHGRWLDAGRYSDGVAALCWEHGAMGRTNDALNWYAQGRTRVLSQQRDETTALVTFEAFARSLQGRVSEAAAELDRVDALLEGHGGQGLRVNAVLTRLHTLVEQGDVGPAFDDCVLRFREFGIQPLAMIRSHRMFAVLDAAGRLARCRGADPARLPARLADARAAVRRLRRLADTPLLSAYALIARAELALVEGRPRRTLRILAVMSQVRRDAPSVAFRSAVLQARAYQATGHAEEALRRARLARSVAVEHRWPQREQQVVAEFGLGVVAGSPGQMFTRSRVAPAESVYVQRLQALQELSKAAARVVDPDELARIALDEIIRILAADRAFLFLTAPDGALTPRLGRDGRGGDVETPTAYSATLVERVRATGEPLVVAGTDDAAAEDSASVVLHGLRSIMAGPIQLDGRLIGVVYLDSRVAKGIFTPADVGILTALTNHIAASFATARAAQLEVSVQTARQQRDVAEMLRDALTRMSKEHDPDRVLAHLLDTAVRVLPADHAWLVVRRAAGASMFEVAAGTATQQRRDLELDPGLDALLDAPAPTVGTAADPPPGLPAGLPAAATSWLCLPLPARGSGLGVLVVASARVDAYRDAQVELGSALAVQGAIAWDNASLFARVQALATVDELTGVPNRRGLFDAAERAVRRAHRGARPLAAAMVDIDHFKRVNDTHGHATGDEVIRAVAARLSGRLRGTDTVGRYGGEEFVVVLPDADVDTAMRLAEALRLAVAEIPVDTRSGELTVTVSVGVAALVPGGDLAGLLAGADEALYRAKAQGRNRVVGVPVPPG